VSEFANNHSRFEHAYSASSHTREGLPAILTGKYPDVAVGGSWELNAESLAEHLGEESFKTGAFHSNPYASRAYGYDRGFDEFDDDLYFGDSRLLSLLQRGIQKLRNKHYARADVINNRALSWIDRVDRPFFLWNHYMDVHGPYEPPGEYRTEYADRLVSDGESRDLYRRAVDEPASISPDERETLQALYDAEIRYLDDRLSDLFRALEKRDLLEESLVVFTADHGEAFGEHGYYAHPRQLHDGMVHVPLIVTDDEPCTVGMPASTIDIVPTILDAFGVESDTFEGSVLTRLARGDEGSDRVVFSQARRYENPCLVRFAARSRGSTAFLEVDTTDGSEVNASGEELLDELRAHASSRLSEASFDDASGETSEAVADRLDALGYR